MLKHLLVIIFVAHCYHCVNLKNKIIDESLTAEVDLNDVGEAAINHIKTGEGMDEFGRQNREFTSKLNNACLRDENGDKVDPDCVDGVSFFSELQDETSRFFDYRDFNGGEGGDAANENYEDKGKVGYKFWFKSKCPTYPIVTFFNREFKVCIRASSLGEKIGKLSVAMNASSCTGPSNDNHNFLYHGADKSLLINDGHMSNDVDNIDEQDHDHGNGEVACSGGSDIATCWIHAQERLNYSIHFECFEKGLEDAYAAAQATLNGMMNGHWDRGALDANGNPTSYSRSGKVRSTEFFNGSHTGYNTEMNVGHDATVNNSADLDHVSADH